MLKRLLRPLYHRAYRSFIRVLCFWDDRSAGSRDLPPAMLRFRVSESLSAKRFIEIGRGCARLVADRLSEKGQLKEGARILDFGCGCGRTLRWMIESHPQATFYGCDIDQEAIRWCRRNLPQGRFCVNSKMPPLGFESGYFDAAYCFSVFTHLNEPMQDAWLTELRRVLKPDGVLIITVHGSNAAARLSDGDRAVLQSRGFLHKTSRKMSGLMPDWYQTTWHSQRYILDKLSTIFANAEYVEVYDGIQDCVAASGSLPSNSTEGPFPTGVESRT